MMIIESTHSILEEERILIWEWLKNQWWGKERSYTEMTKIFDNSDILIVIRNEDDNSLCGFARVLTDFSYAATIYDVVITPDFQGKGVGKRLINYILDLPELSTIHHVDLCCKKDLFKFYSELGFEFVEDPMIMMRHYFRKFKDI